MNIISNNFIYSNSSLQPGPTRGHRAYETTVPRAYETLDRALPMDMCHGLQRVIRHTLLALHTVYDPLLHNRWIQKIILQDVNRSVCVTLMIAAKGSLQSV